MAEGNRNVWYLAVVLTVFLAVPTTVVGVEAVPMAVAAAVGMETCEEACNEFAACDTECFEPIFLLLSSTTCGEWDGGIANLQCEGECGDDLCAEWAGESCTSCSDDCGPCPVEPPCGNSTCNLGETCRNCPADCSCPNPEVPGDGTCGTGEDFDTYDCQTPSEFCEDDEDCPDFGTVGAACVENQCLADDYNLWATPCDPLNPGCPSGWVCGPPGLFGWVCRHPLAIR